MNIYADTNIFIDYISGRNEKSYLFFKEVTDCKHTLLISSLTIKELQHHMNAPLLFELLVQMNKLSILNIDDSDRELAKKDTQAHLSDAIHIVMAQKAQADILLTQNIKDFSHCLIARTYDTI